MDGRSFNYDFLWLMARNMWLISGHSCRRISSITLAIFHYREPCSSFNIWLLKTAPLMRIFIVPGFFIMLDYLGTCLPEIYGPGIAHWRRHGEANGGGQESALSCKEIEILSFIVSLACWHHPTPPSWPI